MGIINQQANFLLFCCL